jgi:branched-chain amino acid transport system substrate-binding protein
MQFLLDKGKKSGYSKTAFDNHLMIISSNIVEDSMKKITKIAGIVLSAVFLLAAASVFAGARKEAAAGNVVKVAVMAPLSGDYARFGELYKASITAAMKAINEDGALKNYTLEFEYIDDKGSTDGAPTAATLALDRYGCHVSIGHLLTTMVLVSGPFFEEKQVPLLGIVSGPASVQQGWKYTSIETGTDLDQADTLINFLINEKQLDRIGLIHVNTEGGMSAANRIEDTLKKQYNKTVMTRDAMSMDDTDFTAQVLKMKNANVNAVVFWGLAQGPANLCMRQIEQLWGKVPEEIYFCGGTSLAQNQMIETWQADDLVGVSFPVGYIPSTTDPRILRFIRDFKAADTLSQDPADVPARVYDSVFHIVTALNTLGPQDVNAKDFTSKLNTALRQAKFTGVQGNFDFSANDNGVGLGQMNIGEWTANYGQRKIYPK